MRQGSIQRRFSRLGSAVLAIAVSLLSQQAIAQSSSTCEPPSPGEYLLLVLNETDDTPTQLEQTLPANASISTCNYLGREVSRVSGFDDPDVASSWAQYLTDIGGLQAFVARPPEATATATPAPTPTGTATAPATPTAPPSPTVTAPPPPALPVSTNAAAIDPASTPPTPNPAPEATQNNPAPTVTAPPLETAAATAEPRSTAANAIIHRYNPQPLDAGYAVLVDYANQPDIAAEVKQLLSRDIGLVSYNQHPYLLALYTADPAVASTVLRTLSDRNFSALVVDSRRAVLLTDVVATP